MQRHNDMDIFEGTYYRLNKRLLFYLGQWPLQTSNQRNFYRTTTILIVGSILLVEVIKFIECLGDLNSMILCLQMLGVPIRSSVRFINCTVQATNMRKLTNRIKDDWTMRTSKNDELILRYYAERGRLYTVFYTAYVFVSLTIIYTIPLVPVILDIVSPLNQTRERVYLIQTEYFVDQDKNYFYILIHAYFGLSISFLIMVAYDTMYVVHVQHACGIFATVGARLRSIGGNETNNQLEIHEDSTKRTDEAYDDIGACIKMHNNAMKIAELIESTNCICFLFALGFTILMITITGFTMVMNMDQPREVMKSAVAVAGELYHLFYICWQGQVLIEHNEDIFINAYNVDWYDISPRAKKLLILIMLRSLKPCQLTAGKVFILSMENFAAALKTSMSYFTVLLSMQ